MRTLYLLRHATTESFRPGHHDRARRLTAEGEREAAAVGEHLRSLGTTPDVVVCSPATRVRQTVAALGLPAPVVVADRLYEAGVEDVLDTLRALDDSVERVLVVGHAPGLPATVHELADRSGSEPAALAAVERGFPPATLATLTVDAAWAEVGTALLTAVHLA